ncbi:MAG: hypothetical protein IKC97_07470, partial [Clostridia bacterium]|nr:hypothetical protein [Clostridia bacterium]
QGGDDNQGGNQGGDDNQGGNSDFPKPPVNVYLDPLDPKNIYAQINRLQLLQGDPVEPKGFKGNSRVWIGKSGYLYEQTYIDEYMGYSFPYNYVTDSGLQETVNKLEYIQKELEKRGITMLYIITPSKAGAYSAYIPDHYKNSHVAKPGYVRPVDRLRTMLANSSINYLDSTEYYKEIGLLVTFPKTGIHWNAPASTEATAKLISMYQQLSGKTSVTIKTTGVNSFDEPPSSVNNEQDIFKILYNMVDASYRDTAIKDDQYYAPTVEVLNPNADKINVLVQGGSFAHSIVHYLDSYGIANVSQIYYTGQNTKTGSISASDPWQKGPEAWEYWLKDKDLVILEANEQQIRSGHKTSSQSWYEAAGYGRVDGDITIGHNVVYDSLYEYLKAHEGEY